MADAKKLIPFILKWEGGFSNHPLDKGGATNKGITISTFRQFFGKNATVEQLKNMTDEQWETILRRGFWDKFGADDIVNQSVANMCVDWAWCSGAATAIRRVQRLAGVKADGIVGRVTLEAINGKNGKEFFEAVKAGRLSFVEAIVRRDPSQKVFVKGWRNRISSINYSV